MSTMQTTESITGAEIHPEIAMPHWATKRYLDDDDHVVVDESSFSHEDVEIEISRSHQTDGDKDYGADVSLWWDNEWPNEPTETQTLTVLPEGIPGLIAALEAARKRLALTPGDVAAAHGRHPVGVKLALQDGALHGWQDAKDGKWFVQEKCAESWALGRKCAHRDLAR